MQVFDLKQVKLNFHAVLTSFSRGMYERQVENPVVSVFLGGG